MTSTWAIETETDTYTTGYRRVPKDTAKTLSMRGERGKRATLSIEIQEVEQKRIIKSGKITVCVDNLNAIVHGSAARPSDDPFKHLQEDYDIRSIVFTIESQVVNGHCIEVKYKHVYNHIEEP